MTNCGQKCFELQDTEYSLAVEKENNQKLEAEIKRLTALIEKMKCCANCSKGHSGFCMGMGCIDENYKLWKLAEER